MTFSDEVRTHCFENYVEPARQRGDVEVSIRAGDVHRDLRYRNRLPLVCAALGTEIFEEMCRVECMAIDGPANGANAVFRYKNQ